MAGKKKADAAIRTEVRRVDPRALKPRDENARFMTAAQMAQLVENLKTDGALTSLPLVYEREADVLEILSGHHRVQAAIAAGFTEIDVLVLVTPLDDARLTAIQLSHNAITGQDDRSILAGMYQGLDLDTRRYSGLTDGVLGDFQTLGLAGISVGSALYEDMHISFLPDDREQFLQLLERIGTKAPRNPVLVARFVDFGELFETLLRVKLGSNVQNVGIAMTIMAELANERLDQIEQGAEANGRDDEETHLSPTRRATDASQRRRSPPSERRHNERGRGKATGQQVDGEPLRGEAPEAPGPDR